MVVTKNCVCLIAILFMFGCGAIQTGSNKPGAFTCNPTAADVNYFKNTVLTSAKGLNATTTSGNSCLGCHGNSAAVDLSRKARFRISTQFVSLTNAQATAEAKEDLCISYMFGQNSPTQDLITHPQDWLRHDGGFADSTTMSDLIYWVQTYRLPIAN